MAITNVAQYAHLNESDMEALGAELDTIRRDIEESRGAHDATYIRRTIAFQRALEAGARLLIATSRAKAGWIVGTVALAFAKCVENMEIGHNVGHGQWDWMNDPEIHSTTWEWDMAGLSSQWRYSHNYRHHVFTNVLDMDDDLGFGVMRLTRDQPWQPRYLMQPLRNLVLAIGFEWGIARHGVHAAQARAVTASEKSAQSRAVVTKITRQMSKDYLIFPVLSRSRWRRTLGANVAANVMRNLWAYVVIFCGHFPDGAEKFSGAVVEQESKPDWYLRQMLGTANFDAGPLMAFASGNLCYQIEHHLFPDLPSNRYAQIAIRVRALCEKFDLPYTTGSLLGQYLQTVRTIHKLALPDRFLDRRLRDGVKRHVGQNFLRTAGQTSISDQAARPATADRPRSDSASGADGVNVVRRTVRKCRGGRSKSPADEQPASHMPESDRDDDRVGPAHVPGAGRGESKS